MVLFHTPASGGLNAASRRLNGPRRWSAWGVARGRRAASGHRCVWKTSFAREDGGLRVSPFSLNGASEARQEGLAASRGAGGYLGHPESGEAAGGAVHSFTLCAARISTGGRGCSYAIRITTGF